MKTKPTLFLALAFLLLAAACKKKDDKASPTAAGNALPVVKTAAVSYANLYYYNEAGNKWIDAQYTANLSYNAAAGNNFLASTGATNYISINGGSLVTLNSLPVGQAGFAAQGNAVIGFNYALNYTFCLSEDAGLTWTNVGTPGMLGIGGGAVVYATDRYVWVATDSYFYRYTL